MNNPDSPESSLLGAPRGGGGGGGGGEREALFAHLRSELARTQRDAQQDMAGIRMDTGSVLRLDDPDLDDAMLNMDAPSSMNDEDSQLIPPAAHVLSTRRRKRGRTPAQDNAPTLPEASQKRSRLFKKQGKEMLEMMFETPVALSDLYAKARLDITQKNTRIRADTREASSDTDDDRHRHGGVATSSSSSNNGSRHSQIAKLLQSKAADEFSEGELRTFLREVAEERGGSAANSERAQREEEDLRVTLQGMGNLNDDEVNDLVREGPNVGSHDFLGLPAGEDPYREMRHSHAVHQDLQHARMDFDTYVNATCPICHWGGIEEGTRLESVRLVTSLIRKGRRHQDMTTLAFAVTRYWNIYVYRPQLKKRKYILPLTLATAYEHITEPHGEDFPLVMRTFMKTFAHNHMILENTVYQINQLKQTEVLPRNHKVLFDNAKMWLLFHNKYKAEVAAEEQRENNNIIRATARTT